MSGMWGSYLEAARRFGANAIFQKPLDIDEILDVVRGLLEAAGVGCNPTTSDCESLVGANPSRRRVPRGRAIMPPRLFPCVSNRLSFGRPEAGNCWRLSIEWIGQTNAAPARPVRNGLVNADLRCARARARRDITVPSGICNRLAISWYCISETTAMSSTSRNCGGIPSMAAAKWRSVNTSLLALVAAAQVSRIS